MVTHPSFEKLFSTLRYAYLTHPNPLETVLFGVNESPET